MNVSEVIDRRIQEKVVAKAKAEVDEAFASVMAILDRVPRHLTSPCYFHFPEDDDLKSSKLSCYTALLVIQTAIRNELQSQHENKIVQELTGVLGRLVPDP